jgi:hypothetical protein
VRWVQRLKRWASKSLTQAAIEKLLIAETLYRNGNIPVKKLLTTWDFKNNTIPIPATSHVCIDEKIEKNE